MTSSNASMSLSLQSAPYTLGGRVARSTPGMPHSPLGVVWIIRLLMG